MINFGFFLRYFVNQAPGSAEIWHECWTTSAITELRHHLVTFLLPPMADAFTCHTCWTGVLLPCLGTLPWAGTSPSKVPLLMGDLNLI